MTLTSAGMPGPLHFSATGCRVIELSGIPPGLFPGSSTKPYPSTEARRFLVCCSDGIIEAQNARYEDFGIERLIEICNASAITASGGIAVSHLSSVHNFTQAIRQHDDMAAAIFQLQRGSPDL